MGGAEGAATAPTRVSTPAAQTRFVLEAMEDLKAALLARFDSVDDKMGALGKMQTHLEEIDGQLHKHAEAL